MNYQTITQVIQQWFIPPVFPDKEQTRAARWLYFILLTLVFLLVSDSLAILLGILDQSALPSLLMMNTIGLLTACGMLLLVRHGYTRVAALILIGVLFVLITYTNAFIFQTVRTPNTASYFALIPLAGLLVGRRNMNLFALLCMVTIVVIFYL